MKIFNVTLLLSICVTGVYASESSTTQYPFSDYDKNVFTNHVTNKVELIYSTPFIESLPVDPMTVTRWELERLSYPAMTRIVFKQHDLAMRHGTINLDFLLQTPQEKEENDRYWKKETEYSTQLATARGTVEKLQTHIHDTNPNIAIPTREVMRMVYYAARKLIYHPMEQVSIVVSSGDDNQRIVVHGEFAKLLTKYRAYEQQ